MLADKVTLMAAADTADVTGLSAQARADRVRAGQVGAASSCATGTSPDAGTGSSPVLMSGAWAVFGGRDWVKNGDAWQVTRRLEDGSQEEELMSFR